MDAAMLSKYDPNKKDVIKAQPRVAPRKIAAFWYRLFCVANRNKQKTVAAIIPLLTHVVRDAGMNGK